MKLRLAAARGNAQQVANLLMGEALHVVQYEHPSRARRQCRNCGFQVHSNSNRCRVLRDEVECIVGGEAVALRAICLFPRQHHVHGQPVKPGAECALTAVERQLVPQAYEHILRCLLRFNAIAQHADAQRVHACHMVSVDSLERLRVAGRCARHVRLDGASGSQPGRSDIGSLLRSDCHGHRT